MNTTSHITTLTDPAGAYEQEIFASDSPKHIIVGVHGNGVRRWDGEQFYYQVAVHFTQSIVVLVDQNQPEKDGCRLNALDIMVERINTAVHDMKTAYPNVPIWLLAHSMGCGVAALAETSNISGMIFVAPTAGRQLPKYIKRYGERIIDGMEVTTSDGLYKNISKEFMDSVRDVYWQEVYANLLKGFPKVHVFEAGDDEILDEERFELRDMPFASYTVIDGAKHNFTGKPAAELFTHIQQLLLSR